MINFQLSWSLFLIVFILFILLILLKIFILRFMHFFIYLFCSILNYIFKFFELLFDNFIFSNKMFKLFTFFDNFGGVFIFFSFVQKHISQLFCFIRQHAFDHILGGQVLLRNRGSIFFHQVQHQQASDEEIAEINCADEEGRNAPSHLEKSYHTSCRGNYH